MSARSETFTNKGVKTVKPFSQMSTFCIFDIQISVSLEIMWL